jgi:ABC-type transport system involved in multi-copper enzyme maturation permease subunit
MNAIATPMSRAGEPPAIREAFAGFGNFARKDLAEWFRTRRFFWTTLSAVGLMVFGVAAAKIARTVDPSAEVTLDAATSMYMAGWETFIPIFAVFSTMGLLSTERENRTLAWSLSMPLTRTSVLVSKLVTSIAVLAVSVVLIPELVAIATARILYGESPSVESMVWPELGGAAIALLLIVLCLATSTFFRSQRAVTGIALSVGLLIPGLVEGFWPQASPWWPISIDHWLEAIGSGKPLQTVTPIVWLAWIAVLAIAARVRFEREEL